MLVCFHSGRIKIKKDSKKKTADINEGQFYWIDPNENFSIKNLSEKPSNFVLLEVK